MAVDAGGSIWITNNYEYNRSPFACVSGGRTLLRLTPTGQDAPGTPYTGGGLYGAGFGIALDPANHLWVGNFGFQGVDNGVDCDPNPPALSVSEFNIQGIPLSPPKGFTNTISQPQGMASDQAGNIWIANCGSGSVTKYPGGNAIHPVNYNNLGLASPFGLAVDDEGNVWVASNGTNSVVGLSQDGKLLPGTPVDVGLYPLGVATDDLGNVWVSNSGVVELPCAGSSGGVHPPTQQPSITEITRNGESVSARSFHGGGLLVPWGIAVDGNDNVWVANFAGRRVSELCGAKPENCPSGTKTGDPISPEGGYESNALMRNTGVAIDPSGNVWLANNWRILAVQTNPGGNGMVEFVGLAAPVRTPVIGPPQRP
jgi:sugar lactone lactonase YvrE